MSPAEIREEIIDILSDIAPDEDLGDLKDEVAFREQLELDSMDFLDIVMELRKRHRIQIPEDDSGGGSRKGGRKTATTEQSDLHGLTPDGDYARATARTTQPYDRGSLQGPGAYKPIIPLTVV